MHLLKAGEDGVDLEGEAPPLGLHVVFLKHVDVFATQVLPLGHWLLNPSCLRDLLSKDLNDR